MVPASHPSRLTLTSALSPAPSLQHGKQVRCLPCGPCTGPRGAAGSELATPTLRPAPSPRSTYDRVWQEAMSELNEQIHIEDDTLDMEPGEKRGPVRQQQL